MSDPEVATRAPESDAAEDTATPSHVPPPSTHQPSAISENDSIAQTGPSMGEHCTTDQPLVSTGDLQPSGSITKLGDIDTYISKPADYPSTPSPLLLLLTGGTGINSINNQIQADRYASSGFVVIMPDQFGSDAAPSTNTVTSPSSDSTPSLLENIKLKAAETAKSFMIDMWLARQTPEKVLPRLHKVLEAARDEYADCISHSGGIYGAGYCFGAKYILILAGEHSDSVLHGQGDEEQGMVQKGPLIKAGAIAHATLVTREDVKSIKAPVSIVAVENDPLFPEEILEIGKKNLASSEVPHEVTVYQNVPHGFAVVGEYPEAHIKKEQEKAFEQMVGWLKNH